MSDIRIRHYEPADLDQVHALYAEAEAFGSTLQLPYASSAHWQRKLDTSQDGQFCLVAVRGDEVLGQLGLEVCRSPRRRHVATLGMGVKASARRLGVGSALLQAAIALCEDWMQVTRIEIEVYTDNMAAIALYRRHGFVLEGTCTRYAFRDGAHVDAHLMARIAG